MPETRTIYVRAPVFLYVCVCVCVCLLLLILIIIITTISAHLRYAQKAEETYAYAKRGLFALVYLRYAIVTQALLPYK